ncbi:MAG: aldo/keto reductase [Gammaproteobacteria bacterium]
MNQRRLGPFTVSSIGFGCMNLSHAYGVPPPADVASDILLRALDLGVTHFDTAVLYGFGTNEELVGRTLGPHRSRFTLASKCGIHGVRSATGMRRVIDGSPATLKKNCEDSLRRLRTDVIDLYYLHRWDKSVAIEDSVGALSDLRRAGKIRAIGLSEVSAATLMRAHAVHPIAAVQSEYSLCTRNPEIAVIEACRSIGATFVAFSPLARGFLAGTLADVASLGPTDIRRSMPRFAAAAHSANLGLLDEYVRLGRAAHASMAQLALAWVLARGEHVVAIPGTTCRTHLEENLGAATLHLQPDLVAQLDSLINQGTVAGERYNATTQAEVDTEDFAAR